MLVAMTEVGFPVVMIEAADERLVRWIGGGLVECGDFVFALR